MTTLDEIKHSLKHLNWEEQNDIAWWLQNLLDSRHVRLRVEEPRAGYTRSNPASMTLDEFLDLTEHSPRRYEFVNGMIHAMAGPSIAHNRIAGELLVAVKSHLRGSPCEAFATGVNLRIRSEADEIIYIPDLVVACNPHEWDERWLCNPKLVAEILSPSTRHIDEREKALTYRRVGSIEEYVLIEQAERKVIVYRRADNWKPQVYTDLDSVLDLRSIGLSVPLTQIYAGIAPTEPPADEQAKT